MEAVAEVTQVVAEAIVSNKDKDSKPRVFLCYNKRRDDSMKPQCLQKGDKVAIVSLSRGLLGEPFIAHELELGLKRLEELGLVPVIMPNALKGMKYLANHPEDRASDLKEAFKDDSIKGIITAIGGDDTFKLVPYLMEDEEFKELVKTKPKIFMGFSDTTNNHLLLNRLGLSTFYGPAIITDFAELDTEMLPYTKEYIDKLFTTDPYEITSSPVWYEERTDFSKDAIGTPRIAHKETHGFETLNGNGIVTGNLYGGCIESIYDYFTGERYPEEKEIYEKYPIFATEEELKEKILFIETCEEKMKPETLERDLIEFKKRNILSSVKGIIVGKPMDEAYYDEYKEVYKRVFSDLDTPVLFNVNFGHATPRTILPYDAEVTVDYDNKKITINSPILEKGEEYVKQR